MITIFPKLMMTIMMMTMIMMIITCAFSNNTDKTISNIFRPFPRKNPMWNRLNGKRRKEQRCKDKRNEKLLFLLSCFWTLLTWIATHDVITSANLVPRVFSLTKKGAAEKKSIPQPRTQPSSRYPSYKRRLGTESEFFPTSLTGDVTSEIAEDDWERGWVSPTATLLEHKITPGTRKV